MPLPPTPGVNVTVVIDFDAANTAPSGPAVVVDLDFGSSGPAPGPDQPITITGRFGFSGLVTANVDAGVHRGVSQQTAFRFNEAASLAKQTAAPWEQPTAAGLIAPQPWHPAEPLHDSTALVWADSERAGRCASTAWDQSQTQSQTTTAVWAQASVERMLRAVAWQAAQDIGRSAAIQWQEAEYTRHRAGVPWQQAAALFDPRRLPWDTAKRADSAITAPWNTAMTLATCRSGPASVRPADPITPNPATVVSLRFCALAYTGGPFAVPIIFGVDPCAGVIPQAPIYITPSRYYMAVHSLTAALLPGLEPIPIDDLSVSADVGSWGWSFSASGPASIFDALTPSGGVPRSIRFTLDGIQWSFIVDQVQRSEQFGKRETRFSGRSLTALVAAPYRRESDRLNPAALNAQQIAAQALDLTGVALDWGIQDWIVPAGAWSHTSTPLDAVARIAEAAGGYLQSARNAATLLVRHPYPLLSGGLPGGPWNWYASGVIPDVELATDSLVTTGIERRDGPDLNGVYVSGQTQGILAFVKRTGTAGEKLGSLITDPLITANVAAQQRGLSILGAAGPKHWVSIELPVLTGPSQPGVLDVGQLVQVNELVPWRGRVRSVTAGGGFGQAVRQTVTIERHLEVAS